MRRTKDGSNGLTRGRSNDRRRRELIPWTRRLAVVMKVIALLDRRALSGRAPVVLRYAQNNQRSDRQFRARSGEILRQTCRRLISALVEISHRSLLRSRSRV